MANKPVSSINVVSQLGLEASIGGGGAANVLLKSIKVEPGIETAIREIMAQGHRFDTGHVLDRQWTSLAVSEDVMTYTEHLLCLENIFGTAGTPTALGTKTQKRVYTPALTGSITPKTWTHQWGDATDNVNAYAYGLLTDYGETWDREAGVKQNGTKGLAQLTSTGATFSASPITLAEQPIGAADWNVYLDTTGANLGTTQITDEIATVDWSVSGMKNARWAANRSYASFGGHVDTKPKATVKFTLYEDGTARTILTNLISGQTYFMRLQAQGPLIETVAGSPSTNYYYLAQRDFALQLAKISPLKDNKGVYGREIEFTITEDTTWGSALQITSQTQEATL